MKSRNAEPDWPTITVNLPEDLVAKVEAEAKIEGVTKDEILQRALDYRLAKERSREVDLAPLYLPRKVVERLAEAGRVADLEAPETAIAEDILSQFVDDHDMLEENIANGYKLTDERKVVADLHVMFARWKAEDSEEGGAA